MKKTLITLALVCVIVTGCDWAAVESGANKAKSAGESVGEVVAQVESIFPAATGATTLVLGLTNIAAAVAAFAARRKGQKIAAAASAAAESVPGGGAALVNAASVLGVAADVAKAYSAIRSTTVSSK
jgi:hypothetical protein